MGIDRSADDYGVELNKVTLSNTMYFGEKITLENAITYNMHRYKSEPEPLWLPIITELMWTPSHFITVYAEESQCIKPCQVNAFKLDLKVGELEKAYVNFTSIYQNYSSDDTNENNEIRNEIKNVFGFGVWLTPKWRLDYHMRTTSPVNFFNVRMNDHEFRLYRDLHCWNFGIRWRVTNSANPDREISLKFGLKTNMPLSGKKARGTDAMFYPWEDTKPIGTL